MISRNISAAYTVAILLACSTSGGEKPQSRQQLVKAATDRVREAVHGLRSQPATNRHAVVESIAKDEDFVLWSGVSTEFAEVIALKALALTTCGDTAGAERLLGGSRELLSEFNPKRNGGSPASTNNPYVVSKYAEAILSEMLSSNTTDRAVHTQYRVRAASAASEVHEAVPESEMGREMGECLQRMKAALTIHPKSGQQSAPLVSGPRGTPPADAGAAPRVPNGEP